MTGDPGPERIEVPGDEYRPSLGKLWLMLVVFALMIPAGAVMAYCWWFQVQLPNGKYLSTKAGICGLLAIPIMAFLVLVMGVLITQAKRLVIGDDRLQLLSRGRVVIEIPYDNIAETYAQGEGAAGVVGLRLRDRNDPATQLPFWVKDRYEIQVLTYGKPLSQLHQAVSMKVASYQKANA